MRHPRPQNDGGTRPRPRSPPHRGARHDHHRLPTPTPSPAPLPASTSTTSSARPPRRVPPPSCPAATATARPGGGRSGGSASPLGRQHRARRSPAPPTDPAKPRRERPAMKQQQIVKRTTRSNPRRWTCAPRPGAPFPTDPAVRRMVDIRREHLCEHAGHDRPPRTGLRPARGGQRSTRHRPIYSCSSRPIRSATVAA